MSAISFIACETLSEIKRIQNKRGWILGCVFSSIGYGIGTTLFILSFNHLWKKKTMRQAYKPQTYILLGYITFIWILNTISTSLAIYATIGALERTCTQQDQIPVNPYFGKANVVYFLLSWCSDALLVWRCKVIFGGSRFSSWIYVGIPTGMLALSFGVGVPTAVLSTISRTHTVNLLLVIYSIVSLSASVVVTSMIVGRLVLHRRRARKVLNHSSPHYSSIIAMLVESAVLVVIMNLFFIISFALNSWYGSVAWQMWIQVQSIAPLLIVYRVAEGKAWSSSAEETSFTPAPIVLVSRETRIHHSKGDGSSRNDFGDGGYK
ncbi:hypothetical protein BDQ17DRAFT_1431900 [Cyathus striatus]|nr:hypothetical protein BDQ17DRAFT_1431900 [Cyathus striatus]